MRWPYAGNRLEPRLGYSTTHLKQYHTEQLYIVHTKTGCEQGNRESDLWVLIKCKQS